MTHCSARVVLLGASNLTRGLCTAVDKARRVAGRPADFLVAMGHGRSYGRRTRVLGRGLPGILECGLWEAIAAGDGGPTYALITDIGNDIVYGEPVDRIADWVGECLRRLRQREARIAMTLLPTASLRNMRPWQFRLGRMCMFPGRRLTITDALERVEALDGRLHELARDLGARVVEQDGRWYGLDPIHPRRRHLGEAWDRMLGAWRDEPPSDTAPSMSLPQCLRLRALTPHRWSLWGRPRGCPQPAGRLPDGSTISLY